MWLGRYRSSLSSGSLLLCVLSRSTQPAIFTTDRDGANLKPDAIHPRRGIGEKIQTVGALLLWFWEVPFPIWRSAHG